MGTVAGAGLASGAFFGFQASSSDRLMGSNATDPRVVVVGIDDASVRAVGQWPFPRPVQADLLRKLTTAGVRLIGYDVLLDPPKPEDPPLIEAMKNVPVVVAIESDRLLLAGPRQPYGVNQLVLPAPAVLDAADAGLVNVFPDVDGVVRTIPLVARTPDGDHLPSLSLAMVLALEGIDTPLNVGPRGVAAGDRFVPTDAQSRLTVNYSSKLGDTSSEVVSAADVLAGRPLPQLKGAVALVGVVAPTLGDRHAAPIERSSNALPGVFIHANAVNTMLTRTYLSDDSSTATIAWVVGLALAVGIALVFLPLSAAVPVPFVLAIAYFLLAELRFSSGRVMNQVYPYLAMLAALVVGLVLKYLTEGRHRRRVNALFAQYVPPAVAARLVEEDRIDVSMEGERLDITVLFCDLRGFTAQSAKMEPSEVREMLDRYYLPLSQMILDHRGTIMQYVGDEIYALFGAPLPFEDHAQAAVDCAIEMARFRGELAGILAAEGLPPVYYGIGVNSGSAVLAHVGNQFRRQYSAIGDTVNIGARLCSQAREDQVCLSEETRRRMTEVPVELEDLGPIEFKNATRPIQVWRYTAGPGRTPSPPEPPKETAAQIV
ncbi:MAG TPA: adenylate/guanylate cyclase domain-containing protein [Acidimicrobiales bacterium]|nr:adenylate/guanylate cyclase domain-containing protein [Acidimicrobiales bacterium]